MRSQNARLPPPGAGIAHTRAFASASINLENTLNSEPRNAWVTSAIRSGSRKSGLSDPKARIAAGTGYAGRQRRDGPVGELGEQPLHHRLDRREHVLLGRERHLEIELVELAGAAVGARVLVAKAGRDLEVAVEAGHHQKLLYCCGAWGRA